MEKVTINGKEYQLDVETCLKDGYLQPNFEWVDLDLPSGTLWASENVDNKYYTFEESMEKFPKTLPTRTQFCELVDYTTHRWDEEKRGMWFIGRNHNKIFLSAYGYRSGSDVYDVGYSGNFWSSTADNSYFAYYLLFDSDYVSPASSSGRDCVLSVRMVKTNFK